MNAPHAKFSRWAILFLLVGASAWGLRQPVSGPVATPIVVAAPAISPAADSLLAEQWLIDLQRGVDARHRDRPEATTQSRLPAGGVGRSAQGVPGAQRVRALLESKRFDLWQQRLQQAGLPATIQARLVDARGRVLNALAAPAKLAPQDADAPRFPILGTALPLQRGYWAAAPLLMGGASVVPSYQQAPAPPPVASDLQDSLDAPLHPEIVAKAAELGNEYTRILDFVRGSIRTEWYPGSQRGALGCLRARAGNDVDQASLLIALLRASNVPARYVQGVGRWSLPELEATLNLQGDAAVFEALNRALRPHRPVVEGGVVTGVEFEQTWISAHVPFVQYRGSAATQTGRVWLPFAPAVKPHVARAATRVLAAAAIDQDALVTEFLTTDPGMSPLERLRALVQPYLTSNPAAGTYADQLALVRPSGTDLELLPASLPFAVVGVRQESAELPPGTAATVRVTVRDESRELLVADLPVLEASSRRLTVSFQPATADDQNLLNSLGGGLSEVPPYLFRLRPRLSVGGEVRFVGEAVDAAKELRLLVLTEVAGEARTVEQTLVSGGMASILIDSGAPRPPEGLDDTVTEDTEPAVSRVLGNLASRYASECRADSGELADLLGVRLIEPLPTTTLALTQMDIASVDGVPLQLSFNSVAIDAAARDLDVISRGGHTDDEHHWFTLAALQCSYLEHRVFEDQWAVPAISADRGLARAHLAGPTVLQLEGAAGIAQLPSLAHPEPVKQALAAWLQIGHRVRIPATVLDVGAWRGSVWQVTAVDGSAGYFVSGGLAGGVTVLPVSDWFLSSLGALFADPYGAAPNLDPTDVLKIRLFDDSDQQIATVVTELPTPLRARIEDPNGRPVVGASVTFSVVAGDGRLTGGSSTGSSVTLTSDRHGLAEVRLRLGTEINSGRYVSERPDDPELHPQFMGVNLVRVNAASRYAPDGIIAGTDYEAFGRPDDVRHIEVYGPPVFRYPDGTEVVAAHAGVGYATWSLMAVDEFGNRIANAPIHLATEFSPIIRDLVDFQCPASAYAGATPGGAFLPGDCPEGEALLTGHSCLRTNIDFKTRASDNLFHVAPHNAAGLELNVTVSTPGAAPKRLILHNATNLDALRFCQSARSQWDVVITHAIVHQGGAAHAVGEGDVSDNTGSNPGYYFTSTDSIESARPGEWLPVPRRFTLYSMENPYPPQNDLLVTWVSRLPGPFYPGNYPSVTPDVIMTTSSGAIASPATWLGGGLFEYNVRMPPGPGKVEVGGRMQTPGNFVVRLDFSFPAVWSVLPRIAEVDPLPFALSAAGTVADDLSIRLLVAPPEYLGGDTVVEFEKSGEIIQRGIGPPILDTGTLMYSRGWTYDPAENYAIKFSINEGTPYRIESDRFPLTASDDVIVGVGLHSGQNGAVTNGEATALALRGTENAHMLRAINVSANDYCNRSGELVFLLARRARVRADFYRKDEHGNVSPLLSGTLINDEWFDAGLGRKEVLADNLPIGRFEVRVRATTESGVQEELRTTLTHQVDRRDHLGLGHTVIADVDLFDGQVTVSRQDLQLPGRGPELALQRTWSSQQGARIGSLGRGWSSNLNVELHLNACRPQLVGAQGAGTEFEAAGTEPDGSLRYRALHGYHGSLYQRPDGSYDVYAKDGTRYHFARGNGYLNPASNYRIVPVAFTEDPNGNRVTRSYRWLGGIPVTSALSGSGGRNLELEYELRPTGGDYEEPGIYPLLMRARAPGGFELLFAYDGNAQLTRVHRTDAPFDETYTYQDFGFVEGTDESWHRLGSRMLNVRDEVASRTRQSFTYELQWVHSPRGGGNIDVLPELRVVRHANALGQATRFEFQGLRGLGQAVNTVVTSPRSIDTNYRMNGFGGVDRVVDPIGTSQTEWNLEHRQPSRQVDREAVVTDFEYDEFGNVLRERRSGRGSPVEQRYTWKAPENFDLRILNRPASHTDFAGVGEIYQYDQRGNRVSRTRSGETESWTYGANGDVASWTDFEDAQTSYTYDSMGLLVRTVHADSAVSRQAFDARGRPLSRTDEVGRVETYTHDGLDRLTVTTFADGSQREVRYLDAEDVRREIDELGRVTVHQLDALGRAIKVTNALGDFREMDYDGNGNLTRERKFDGTETTHEYDLLDRRTRTTEPLGRVTERDYDRAGNLTEERVAVGPGVRTTRHQYDHPRYFRTQTARLLDSRELTTLEARDGEGRLTLLTDPLGRQTEIDYDGFGRETERSEPLGRVTQRNYDGMGRLTSELLQYPGVSALTRTWAYDTRGRETSATDRAGGQRTRTYDAAGQLLSLTDPSGRTTSYTYDARGRVVSETRPGDGRVRSVTYDAVGNVLTETRPSQSPIAHVYDDLNRRKRSTDALGSIEELDYDEEGRVVARRDALGAETTYDHDDLGRQIRETRPLAREWIRTWTLHDELASERNPRGFTTTHDYDALGRRISTIDPAGTQSWAWDDLGNQIRHTDRLQRATVFHYDALNRRTRQDDPAPLTTHQSWRYDALDRVIGETDRKGIETVLTLDGEGRELQRSRAGRDELQSYDAAGRRASHTDGQGRITTFVYDTAGRLQEERRPLGATVRYNYGTADQLLSSTDADGVTTTYTYDLRLRRITESNALAEVTHFEYDGRGLRTAIVKPASENHRWKFDYDAAGRLEKVTDPLQNETVYGYDPADNLTSMTNAREQVTGHTYDASNRLTRTEHPGGAEELFTPDAEGNREVWVRENDQRLEMEYDALNRLVETRRLPAAADGIDRVVRLYDGNGNLTRVEEYAGAGAPRLWTASYDAFNRRTDWTDRNGLSVHQRFDASDNRIERTGPEGSTSYTYNALDQLQGITPPAATATTATVSRAGRLSALDHANGTRTEVSRDAAGRVSQLRHALGAAALLTLGYTLDANGHRVAESWERGSERIEIAYELDLAERLKAVTTDGQRVEYTLDEVGNRTAESLPGNLLRTHHYDERDRLTETREDGQVVASYGHDAAGRQTSHTAAGITRTYQYDTQDRLLEVSEGGNPIVRYEVDAFGQRTLREAAGSTELYQFDGTRLAGITNALGTSLADYQHAYGWAISSREGSIRSTLHTDVHGTPQLITDGTAAIAGWTRTDVWGVEKASTGLQSRLGHTGYLKDPLLSDELYAQARQYRAGVGRFTSRDEWAGDNERPLTLNSYLAFLGNPGALIDPDGRCPTPMTDRDCFDAMAESIGADLSTREGLQQVGDLQVETAKMQLQGATLLAGGLIGRTLLGAGTRIVQAFRAGGWRYAATATMPEQILLAETAGTAVAVATGAELPPTPLSPVVQGTKAAGKALTSITTELEVGLGTKLADDVPVAPPNVLQSSSKPSVGVANNIKGTVCENVSDSASRRVGQMPIFRAQRRGGIDIALLERDGSTILRAKPNSQTGCSTTISRRLRQISGTIFLKSVIVWVLIVQFPAMKKIESDQYWITI
ncbi:MAG: hypothetical protein IPK27_08285 [Rhodanobacteraceae bacterium]|nr:hypothetical protein [Rhodanobacteraceae bacterium]